MDVGKLRFELFGSLALENAKYLVIEHVLRQPKSVLEEDVSRGKGLMRGRFEVGCVCVVGNQMQLDEILPQGLVFVVKGLYEFAVGD